MQTMTELALEQSRDGVFTREQAATWVDGSVARLDALLKRAVAHGEVVRIRRGFYCLSDRYQRRRPFHPMDLASLIYGRSYISLESALSFHGWIPEAVPIITSVTLERSKAFDTPVGRFTFDRVPQDDLFAGVEEIPAGAGSFRLATPLKALADLVYVQKHDWKSVDPVLGSLRVEEEDLAEVNREQLEMVRKVYRSSRILRFLDGLQRDLGL